MHRKRIYNKALSNGKRTIKLIIIIYIYCESFVKRFNNLLIKYVAKIKSLGDVWPNHKVNERVN